MKGCGSPNDDAMGSYRKKWKLGNREIKKLRGSNSGGIDQVRASQKQGDTRAMPGKESWKKKGKAGSKKKKDQN